MLLKTINLQNFPRSTKSDWVSAAKNQLKGRDPYELLCWKVHDLTLMPYYDASDLTGLEYLVDFFQTIKPFEWKLYEEIPVKNDVHLANEKALEALKGGCDGVIFRLSSQDNIASLLNNVMIDMCDVSFIAASNIKDLIPSGVKGFFLMDGGNAYSMIASSSSPVWKMVECIENIGSCQHIVRHALSDFFLEIAVLRALRFLLTERLSLNFTNISIHTIIPLHRELQGQWFLNATIGLASILGGSHTITFTTNGKNPRISRNVGHLIREEAGIRSYNGQCNGAYYVESLTHQLIEICKSHLTGSL